MNGMTFALIIGLTALTANAIPNPKKIEIGYQAILHRIIGKQSTRPTEAVFVGPNVVRPGAYPLKQNTSIMDLLKEAGGIGPAASMSTIALYRPTKEVPNPENPTFWCQTKAGPKPSHNLVLCGTIILENGDLVYVQERSKEMKYVLP
jgi:hypothetical protein